MPSSSEHAPLHDPYYLLTVKGALQELWQELPAEHQATMILVLLKQVIQSEYQVWVRDAIIRLLIGGKGEYGMD